MDSVTVDLKGVDQVLELLRSLPPEVVSKRGGPVKAALRAGARVILREAALNLARATNSLGQDEARSTGLLLKNLVATRGKKPFGTKGERYLVRVRRKAYQRKGEVVTTLKTANLLEYGSSQQPPEPWLRPAFNTKAREAIDTATAELVRGLDKAVRKLSKGQGGLS